ncbi:MAG: ParB/RepB/Spo0J family partition protein [Gammaproteobacteria bacterium]|jgi:ParB family chromosome partitioning protein|nr:ParB/RepB/Spo0J family partition protein [Gammaproteobacteria bacterium]
MIVKKRGLGRGLDALLSGSNSASQAEGNAEEGSAGISKENELRQLPVDLLQPGKYQPRTDMHNESLQDLANSIRAQGMLQPIVVREVDGGRFEIIAGERRWRAAQLAELHEIPAVVRDVPDEAAIAMALIENIQRENLNPVEEARALQRLIEEFEMTHQQASEAIGRSRAAVTNLLRLLSLEPDVRKLLENGDLEMGHARAILTLEGELQSKAARDIAAKGLSVREAEQLVRKLRSEAGKPAAKSKEVDPNIIRLQDDISEKLGAKVIFQHATNGKGKVIVHYNSLDELDGILAHIK